MVHSAGKLIISWKNSSCPQQFHRGFFFWSVWQVVFFFFLLNIQRRHVCGCNFVWICLLNSQWYTFWRVWFTAALKKIRWRDVIAADVRSVNIPHQVDTSGGVFPGRPCLSISCLFNLQPTTLQNVWRNIRSDGNVIIKWTLIAIWEGLEIRGRLFIILFICEIVMASCCTGSL